MESINDKWIRKCLQLITVHLPHKNDPPVLLPCFYATALALLTFVFGTSDISDCFLSL